MLRDRRRFVCVRRNIQALILFGRMFINLGIERKDGDHFQLVTLPHRIVVKVMRRRDFNHARAEVFVHVFVCNNGNVAFAQRQFYFFFR